MSTAKYWLIENNTKDGWYNTIDFCWKRKKEEATGFSSVIFLNERVEELTMAGLLGDFSIVNYTFKLSEERNESY